MIQSNTAVGSYALDANAGGVRNTGVGLNALGANVSGTDSAGVGHHALILATGSQNTAFGAFASAGNAAGGNNVTFGFQAGDSITSGSNNLVVGFNADIPTATSSNQMNIGGILWSDGVSTGSQGSAVSTGGLGLGGMPTAGTQFSIISGATTRAAVSAVGLAIDVIADTNNHSNANGTLAIGATAALGIITHTNDNATLTFTDAASLYIAGAPVASTNVAITNTPLALWVDAGAVRFDGDVTVSGTCTGCGLSGIAQTSAGDGNTAGGSTALDSLTAASGLRNTAFGADAGTAVTTGDDNVLIGWTAGDSLISGSRNTFVGSEAGQANTANDNTGIGYQALRLVSSGTGNTSLGTYSLNAITTASNSTAVGYNALLLDTGGSNTAVGSGALDANTSGTNNVGIGLNALGVNQTGTKNIAIGVGALNSQTGPNDNIAIGDNALNAVGSSERNIALGSSALSVVAGSDDNIAIGHNALLLNTASNNIAIGSYAFDANTSGTRNVAIGHQALTALNGGDDSTAIGYNALLLDTGGSNIAIGSQAGNNITSGANNIVIGMNIDAPSATASNQLNIGNTIFGLNVNATGTTVDPDALVGIGTAAPGARLDIDLSDVTSNSEQLHFRSQAQTQTITGAVASARFNQFLASTITAATAQTVTDAATLYIDAATTATGAGPATITNNYALWIDDGASRFDGSLVADILDNQTEDGAVCITSGNVFSDETDGVCDASSITVKTDVREIENGLTLVGQMRPVFFKYKEDFKPDFQISRAGFIAEEMHLIVPEVVTYSSYDKHGLVNGVPDGIDYAKLTAVLTKAIQELDLKIENVKALTIDQDSIIDRVLSAVWSKLADAGNGITKIFTNEVHTDKLCVGQTCVTESQLIELLHSQSLEPEPVSITPPENSTPEQETVVPGDEEQVLPETPAPENSLESGEETNEENISAPESESSP